MSLTLEQMDKEATELLKTDQDRKIKDLKRSESVDADTFFKFGESN